MPTSAHPPHPAEGLPGVALLQHLRPELVLRQHISIAGVFGPLIFQTSDRRILVPSGFTLDSSGRWSEHELLSGKPRSQFGGPGLKGGSFDIVFNSRWGVRPRAMLALLNIIVETGQHFHLIIGGRPVGRNSFYIPNTSETWDVVYNGGELARAKINITIKEYR